MASSILREESIDKAKQIGSNHAERVFCVLVLDGSESMLEDGKIDKLNEGLRAFETELKGNQSCILSVRVMVLRFGEVGGRDDVEVLTDWCDAKDFAAPTVRAKGRTPLGAAMNTALQKIGEEKEFLKSQGIHYKRPWLFVMSDGVATDPDVVSDAVRSCREAEDGKHVLIFPIAVEPADAAQLSAFSPARGAAKLNGVRFEEFFQWVSSSMEVASNSGENESVNLPSTDGWRTVTV